MRLRYQLMSSNTLDSWLTRLLAGAVVSSASRVPDMFADDTDEIDWSNPHQRWSLESALADIDRSIEMAEVRLRPVMQLIEGLPNILNDAESDRILYRLEEVQLEPHEAQRLAE